jgi:hypothetical protein
MSKFTDRVVVVAKAVPTYLVAASLVASIATEEIAEELSGDAAQNVVRVGGKVVAWLGAAIAIIRRSTPVIKSQRGLLEPESGPIIPVANMPGGPEPHADV